LKQFKITIDSIAGSFNRNLTGNPGSLKIQLPSALTDGLQRHCLSGALVPKL